MAGCIAVSPKGVGNVAAQSEQPHLPHQCMAGGQGTQATSLMPPSRSDASARPTSCAQRASSRTPHSSPGDPQMHTCPSRCTTHRATESKSSHAGAREGSSAPSPCRPQQGNRRGAARGCANPQHQPHRSSARARTSRPWHRSRLPTPHHQLIQRSPAPRARSTWAQRSRGASA